MNSIYFSIGFAIILALVAALVGPYFIDWTAYRAEFESRASIIIGHPVHVAGTADASLLPYPKLAFTNVVIGEDQTNPLMTVARFDLEVELFPLLSGEVKVTQMKLDQPEVNVRIASDGSFEWISSEPHPPVDPARVVLDHVTITHGAVRILDDRRPAPLEALDINAELEARSLLGPFRFDGSANVEGERLMIKASTGTGDSPGKFVLKAAITPASRPLAITLDGQVSAVDRQPTWSGRGRIQRVIAEGDTSVLPWSVESNLDIDPRQLLAKDIEFQYGPEDRPFSITGAATIDYTAETQFNAVLSARQIDLDRTLGNGPDKPVAFSSVLAAMAEGLKTLPRPTIPGSVGFDIPGVVVGGGIVANVQIDLSLAESGWHVETLSADMPGKTSVVATGDLTTIGDLAFDGSLALSSDQPSAFISWWSPEKPRSTLSPFEARAQINASAAGVHFANIEANVNKSRLIGDAGYVPARTDRNAQLTLDVNADSFDFGEARAIAGLFDSGANATDILFSLKAGSLSAGETDAGGVDIAASLANGALTIDRLNIQNIGGARISASGAIRDLQSTPDGSIQLHFAAEDLRLMANTVSSMLPETTIAQLFSTAAPSLGPAVIDATVTAKAGKDRTDIALVVDGSAAGSTLKGKVDFGGRIDAWRDGDSALDLTLAGPSGIRLMQQLGFEVPDSEQAGAGHVQLTAKGSASRGLVTALDVSLGETKAVANGTISLPGTSIDGHLDVTLKSPDVGPILALAGNPVADILQSTPVDVSAGLDIKGGALAIKGLTGIAADAPLRGDLAVNFASLVPSLTGKLALASSSVQALGEMALGSGTLAFPIIDSGSPWPESPFGMAALDGLNASLDLTFDKLDIDGTLVADKAAMRLSSSAAAISFDGITAKLNGGDLSGNIVIKKDLEGTSAVSTSLKLVNIPADSLVWRQNDRAVMTGNITSDLQFDATGRTVAGLVASLTGGGAFTVDSGVIHSMNPTAFTAVVRAFDGGKTLTDDAVTSLFADNIDAGDLAFSQIEGTYSISAGVLRAPSITVTSASAQTTGSATIDLPHQTLQSDWTLAALNGGDGSVGDTAPQVALLFRGSMDSPSRKIDATAFSSYLNIRSVERETERVLVMQADTLERDMMVREIQRNKEAFDRRQKAAEEARKRAEADAAAAAATGQASAPDQPPANDNTPPSGGDFVDGISKLLDQTPAPAEPLPVVPAPAPAGQPRAAKPLKPLPPPVDVGPGDNFLPGVVQP